MAKESCAGHVVSEIHASLRRAAQVGKGHTLVALVDDIDTVNAEVRGPNRVIGELGRSVRTEQVFWRARQVSSQPQPTEAAECLMPISRSKGGPSGWRSFARSHDAPSAPSSRYDSQRRARLAQGMCGRPSHDRSCG